MHKKQQQQKRSLKGASPLNNQEVWYRGVSSTSSNILLLFQILQYSRERALSHPGDAWFLSIIAHIFFIFFLKTCERVRSLFLLHSLSLNSLRTVLSHQSLLRIRIQNLCVVRGGINC